MSLPKTSPILLPALFLTLLRGGSEAPRQFENVTERAGIEFQHRNSATAAKYVVETMGSGCAFLDLDRDGWLDIFLVNGGPLPGGPAQGAFSPALYRNLKDGTFEEVTRKAGIRESAAYGQGVAVGDYDNDGHQDLFLTHFGGPSLLYRNNGDGTFSDATSQAGVAGDGQWSTSAAFLDFDRDGFLDLYVVRYIDHSLEKNIRCGSLVEESLRTYCTPKLYNGVPDLLYRNNGDGTFSEVGARAGIARPDGKGLGVVAADFNLDGWTDVYVANDTTANFLFENRGDGTFTEVALARGAAVDENGLPQAGMGVAFGDYDNDGRPDLAVTNLDFEYLALYRNRGQGFFEDASAGAGVLVPSAPLVGFGLGFLDFDNDGDLDLLAVNGHIFENAEQIRPGATYRQPKLLLENTGPVFSDGTRRYGPALAEPQVSRGMALGDFNNDGAVDVLVSNCGGRPALLENRVGSGSGWLSVRLVGSRSNRDGLGALLRFQDGDFQVSRQVFGGGSYLSASDYRVHLGMGGRSGMARVEITWPSGVRQVLEDLAAGREWVVEEPRDGP